MRIPSVVTFLCAEIQITRAELSAAPESFGHSSRRGGKGGVCFCL